MFFLFRRTVRARTLLVLSLAVLSGGVGCTPSSSRSTRADLQSDAAKDFAALKLNEVVVLPLSAVGRASATLSDEQLRSYTDTLVDTLDRETSLSVLNHSAPQRVEKETSSRHDTNAADEGGLRERAIRVAASLGAQGVLVGQIGRFDELEGSRFGGEQLAAVGFRLLLLDGKTGRTVWSASYDHSDEPLSNNLFRLGETLHRGVGFRPARELLQSGFRDAARSLQSNRLTTASDTARSSSTSSTPAR